MKTPTTTTVVCICTTDTIPNEIGETSKDCKNECLSTHLSTQTTRRVFKWHLSTQPAQLTSTTAAGHAGAAALLALPRFLSVERAQGNAPARVPAPTPATEHPLSPPAAKGAGTSAQMLKPPQGPGARVRRRSPPPRRSSRSPAPPQRPRSCSPEVSGSAPRGQGGFTKDRFSPKAQSPPPGMDTGEFLLTAEYLNHKLAESDARRIKAARTNFKYRLSRSAKPARWKP